MLHEKIKTITRNDLIFYWLQISRDLLIFSKLFQEQGVPFRLFLQRKPEIIVVKPVWPIIKNSETSEISEIYPTWLKHIGTNLSSFQPTCRKLYNLFGLGAKTIYYYMSQSHLFNFTGSPSQNFIGSIINNVS